MSIRNVIVDLKYYCRFGKWKSIWIIVLKVWDINFDFKNKYVDWKYSYRFEIVFYRFQNLTAVWEMDLDLKYNFFGLKCICRFEKYLLGMTLLGHRTFQKIKSFKLYKLLIYILGIWYERSFKKLWYEMKQNFRNKNLKLENYFP